MGVGGNLAMSNFGPDTIASLDGRVAALEDSFSGSIGKGQQRHCLGDGGRHVAFRQGLRDVD